MDGGAWFTAVHGVAKSQTRLSNFTFIFHFHALEKEMATHSSVLAWRIPGMGEPGGLPSLGLHRVGHNWSDLAAACSVSQKKKKKSLYTDNRWKIALKTTTNYKDAWDYIWVLLNPTNPLPQQGLFIQIISVPNKIEDPPQYPHHKNIFWRLETRRAVKW